VFGIGADTRCRALERLPLLQRNSLERLQQALVADFQLGDTLGLHEETEIISSAGFGIRTAHVEATERVGAHQPTRYKWLSEEDQWEPGY